MPRRISGPSWLDLRLVLGVLLVLSAVLVGALVVGRARDTDPQLVLTRDVAAGTTLRADDVRVVQAQLPDSDRVYATAAPDVVGKVVDRALVRGELLPAAALGRTPPRTTVSVPFEAGAAPRLGRGQRIVVWLSTPACPSMVLLPDVTVQDVLAAENGAFTSGAGGQDVVLSVEPPLAQRLVGALAIDGAVIRAGVLSGAAAADGGALPELDACMASAAP